MEKNTEIYGIRAVIEAINSSKDIDKVFIQTGLKGKLIGQLESLIRKNKINFSYVPTQKLDRLSKKNHQGVIARIAPIKFYTIDSFSEVLEKSNNPFVLILDQINDVRNFGAIIRTAEISGVDGIIHSAERLRHDAPLLICDQSAADARAGGQPQWLRHHTPANCHHQPLASPQPRH